MKPSHENRGRKSKQGTNSLFTHSFSSFGLRLLVPMKGDLRGSASRIKWHPSPLIVATTNTKGPIWSLCLVCPICTTPWRRTCFLCRYKRLILTGRCRRTRLRYVSEAVRLKCIKSINDRSRQRARQEVSYVIVHLVSFFQNKTPCADSGYTTQQGRHINNKQRVVSS